MIVVGILEIWLLGSWLRYLISKGVWSKLLYIIIIIISEVERNSNYNFKLKFQFCAMCSKLFIFKEFYFLILESIWDHIINIHPNKLLNTKTKESRINES